MLDRTYGGEPRRSGPPEGTIEPPCPTQGGREPELIPLPPPVKDGGCPQGYGKPDRLGTNQSWIFAPSIASLADGRDAISLQAKSRGMAEGGAVNR